MHCLLLSKSTSAESVNHVNNYFAHVDGNLAREIITMNNERPIDTQPNALNNFYTRINTFVQLDVFCEEVYSVLVGLKNDSTPGCDNVLTRFLKLAHRQVVPVIWQSYASKLVFSHYP